MIVARLRLRNFRSHARVDVPIGPGLTVVHGPNGSGKTNLVEGLYFGCTGRSCRTTNEREVVRFDAAAARVEVDGVDDDGAHTLAVGFQPGEAKRYTVDGAPVERLLDDPRRPLASVFLPDRLELVKGPPALRRSHVDALVAGLWPARAAARRDYAKALGQRNALLGRVRAGQVSRAAMAAWDLELARHALVLRAHRAAAADLIAAPVAAAAADLGLAGTLELRYRPRSVATDVEMFAAELAERLDADLDRGFTQHGPHRDELLVRRDGRDLRVYGSQGEQRLGLLALLLGERAAIEAERGVLPLMLLDDVLSELDAERRERLVARVGDGQSIVTTTDLAHVPESAAGDAVRLAVSPDGVLTEVCG